MNSKYRKTILTNKKLLMCMENNFEIVCGVHPVKNDTPSTGKSTLCHNILITQQTKIFVCMETVYRPMRAFRALAQGVHGGPEGWPLAGVARGQRPLA